MSKHTLLTVVSVGIAMILSSSALAKNPYRKVAKRLGARHVVDFTRSRGVNTFFAQSRSRYLLHDGPTKSNQYPVRRGQKLLVVLPKINKAYVDERHDLKRRKDFINDASFQRAIQSHRAFTILDGRIDLGNGKQGVLVKANRPHRLSGSNMVLHLVKPDRRSSRAIHDVYGLQAIMRR
jgi:hypothetical protein